MVFMATDNLLHMTDLVN